MELLNEAEYELDQATITIVEYLDNDITTTDQDNAFLKAQEKAELAYQKIYNAIGHL